MVVSQKTDLRFPVTGQQGHGHRIIQLIAPMVYYLFFSSMLYSIINKFIKTMEFDISKYTIFGAPKYLVGDLSNSILMREAIVLIIYLIIIIFISFEGIRRSEI